MPALRTRAAAAGGSVLDAATTARLLSRVRAAESRADEEAFRDLLKKYGRSADFREALKLSARKAGKKGS